MEDDLELSHYLLQMMKMESVYNGIVLLVTLFLGKLLYGWGRSMFSKLELTRKRKKKTQQCKDAIEKMADEVNKSNLSVARRETILSLCMTDLLSELQSGKITALQALQAYQYKALEIHRESNCLVEPILEAREMAMALDKQTSKRGPLHGLPVSIKDNYLIKGYESTYGCSRQIGNVATEDAVLVKILKEAGAIPFVRTNVPQTMYTHESSNPIFGLTTLPGFAGRSAGGSSGGEGALVGAGGSLLGLGNDIGGSIRLPAHFCGCTAIKPGSARLSFRATVGPGHGQSAIPASNGPMCRDVDSVVTAMRVLLQADTSVLDPHRPHIPFKEQMYTSKKKLRLGMYTETDIVATTEPCKRAINITAQILKDMGHEIVEIDVADDTFDGFDMYLGGIFGDGLESVRQECKDDAIDPSMKVFFLLGAIPNCIRNFLAALFQKLSPITAKVLRSFAGQSSVYDWWIHCEKVEKFRYKMLDKWRSMGLDGLIAPFAVPSMVTWDIIKATGHGGHLLMYNLLDLPVGVLPITKVSRQDEEVSKNYPTSNPWEYTIKKSITGGSIGLPVGVQIVGFPFQEELCLRLMKEVETTLHSQS